MPSEASLANLRPAWQPNQSGNERGANRGYRRVLASARRASPEAMEAAVKCMRDESASWRERLAAIQMILDRAWGRPKEHLQLDGTEGMQVVIVTGVPRAGDDEPVVTEETRYTIDYDPQEGEP